MAFQLIDRSSNWQIARFVVALRLLGFRIGHIADLVGVPKRAVQIILIEQGHVERRRDRYRWRGAYSITPDKALKLKLPGYIPREVANTAKTLSVDLPYQALVGDLPVGHTNEPFHAYAGADLTEPSDWRD